MPDLPQGHLPATGRPMGGLLIRLAILFSVIMAGLHVPVAAALNLADNATIYSCAEQGHPRPDHHSSTTGDQQGGETTHHHHCPMALEFDGAAGSSDLEPLAQLHFPVTPDRLSSRATAPPLDPPLA